MASYKLPLKMSAPGTQEFDYHLDSSFFNVEEPSDVHDACVQVHLTASRKADDLTELDFACRGTLTLPCDRCLDDMELPIDVTYHLSVKSGKELDDSRDGVLVVPEHWRELDLGPLMRDTVLLAIPIMHVHPEGQCNEQMLAVLREHQASIESDADMPATELPGDGGDSDESDDGTDPRWDALRGLIGKD